MTSIVAVMMVTMAMDNGGGDHGVDGGRGGGDDDVDEGGDDGNYGNNSNSNSNTKSFICMTIKELQYCKSYSSKIKY